MRKRTQALLVAMVLLVGSAGALAPAASSNAADPLVLRGILVFIKSVKRATVDRAEAIGAVNASRDEDIQELEQARAVADYYEQAGWITPEQRQTVHEQIDELEVGREDLARRERQIVRHDTKFIRALGENVRAEARLSAPQILVKLGVPEAAARVAGAALQGEKPLSAVLDAAITKVTGGQLVDPAEDPLADLKAQLGALQDATDALRGTSKVRIAAELLGIQQKLEEITGLPLPDQGAELGTLRRAVEEAEATLEEAGAVRNEWLPRWMGPSNERFARDGKHQAILEELLRNSESRIEGAVAAGMASKNEERLVEALRAAGREPTDEAIADLRAALTRATAEAWAAGLRPRADELIEEILQPAATPTQPAPDTPTSTPGDGTPTAEGSPTSTVAPTATPTPTPTPTPSPTPTPTPSPTPTPTPTPSPTPTPRPPTATPTNTPTPTEPALPQSVSISASFTLVSSLPANYAMSLQMTASFQAGSISGTLGGSVTRSDTSDCGVGDVILDTAVGQWTDVISGSVAGGLDSATGAFSGTVSFTHSWSFELVQPFTHPDCTQFNTGLPAPGSHGGSGTISGTVSPSGAASFSIDTDHGSGGWSGTGAVNP